MLTWLNPSGGIFYHYLAIKYHHSKWINYRKTLNQLLINSIQQTPRPFNDLLIIGPSGGYSLETNWLNNFQSITCVDPDPIAKVSFKFKHKIKHLDWDFHNYFSDQNQKFNLIRINELKEKYHDSLWLFSNILGQFPLMFKSTYDHTDFWSEWGDKFKDTLKDLKWISYHDILSSNFKYNTNQIKNAHLNNDLNDLTQHLYSNHQSNSEINIVDHGTFNLFDKSFKKELLEWELANHKIHIIEFCTNLY